MRRTCKEQDLKKAYKCLGIGDSHEIEHKIEKEKLKKEYWRN